MTGTQFFERAEKSGDVERMSGKLSGFVRPTSIAVVGAAERETSSGGAVLRNLRISGFKGRVPVSRLDAVGVIETKEVASAIFAGDAAVKAAEVTLIEARNQPGGKGLVVLTGDVGAVLAAVAAGRAAVK